MSEHLPQQSLLDWLRPDTGFQTDIALVSTAMRKVSALLPKKPNDFLDADYILTEIIAAYGKHPTLRRVGKIGNALVGYRRTATSSPSP